jgi:hypothetical protein
MNRMARPLLVIACLLAGLLAGGNVDRSFVAMPAWQQVGATAWADFSRHADLGNGLILYPLEAIGGALFALAAAICIHFDRTASRAAVLAIEASAVLAAGGLALTFKAAPIMLGIRGVTDSAALTAAFEGFRFWGDLRAVCQILAFVAQLIALGLLLRGNRQSP